MALNSLGLGFVFRATDMASPVLKKVENRFKDMDEESQKAAEGLGKFGAKAGAGLTVAAVGAAGLAGSFKAANAFASYERELGRVGAISRATSEEMDMLGKRAIKAGIETQFSPDESVAGLTELALRGLKAQEQVDALGGALDFASGAQIGVAKGSATVASALKVFGKDASFATDAADKLLKVSNISAIQGNELEQMLGNVSRGAIATGQSMEEMLAVMGLVRNTGVEASIAASSVSSALQFIAKNADQFDELGIKLTHADGSFRNLGDIILDTKQKLDQEYPDAAQRATKALKMFGRFGVSTFESVGAQMEQGVRTLGGEVKYGADALAYLRQEMQDTEGTAASFREQFLSGLEGQKTLLRGTLQTIGVVVGESFASVLTPLVTHLTSALNFFIKIVTLIPAPIKNFAAAAFMAASAMLVIAGAVVAVKAGIGVLRIAFIAFKAELIAVGMIAAKAMLVLGAIAAVFYGIKKAYDQNLGGLADGINKIVDKIKLFYGAIEQLTSGDGKLRGNILKGLTDPTNEGVLRMVKNFHKARFRIKAFWKGFKDAVNGTLQTAAPVFASLKEALTALFEAFGFGNDAMQGLSASSGHYMSIGETLGKLITNVLLVGVRALTFGIWALAGAVKVMTLLWTIVKPIIGGVVWILGKLVDVVNVVLGAFNILGGGVEGTAGALEFFGQLVGIGIGLLMAWRMGAMMAAGAMAILRGVTAMAAVAQAAFGLASAPMLVMILAIGAAIGAVALAFDLWSGKAGGLTDKLLGLNKHLYMTEKQLNAIGQTGKRGLGHLPNKGFMTIEQAAAQANGGKGMSAEAFIDKRSTELAAERRESKAEIMKRMKAKLEVERAAKGTAHLAAAGQKPGVAGKTNRQGQAGMSKEDYESAMASALEQFRGKSVSKGQQKLVFNVDGQQMAEAMAKAQNGMDALDWEADRGGTDT